MKALTLHQPWASLVALGAKKVETRSWRTNYRGPLAIHAAKALPKSWAPFRSGYFLDALEHECGITEYGALDLDELPVGAVLCVVNLVDVVRMEIDVPPYDYGLPGYSTTPQEHAFGEYGPGRYGWVFDLDEQPMLLDPPIEWKGRQGLWDLPSSSVFETAPP